MLSVVKSTNVKGSFDTANGTFMLANPVPFYHHQLSSAQVESQEVKDVEECIFACGKATQCHSVNFKTAAEANGKFLCHLLDTDKFVSPVLFTESLDSIITALKSTISIMTVYCNVFFQNLRDIFV